MILAQHEPEINAYLYEETLYFEEDPDNPLTPDTDLSSIKDPNKAKSLRWDELAKLKRVEFKDVEELTASESHEEIVEYAKRFSNKFASIFGKYYSSYSQKQKYDKDAPESFSCLKEHMIIAMRMKKLIDSDTVSFEELEGLGFTIVKQTSASDDEERYTASYSFPIKGVAFREYMAKAYKAVNRHSAEHFEITFKDKTALIISVRRVFRDTSDDIKECCSTVLDVLSEIHLFDVSTITTSGELKQRPNCIAADLWYRMCYRFRNADIVFCKGCGNPLISPKNQGKPREHCDNNGRCRQRARRKRLAEAGDE